VVARDGSSWYGAASASAELSRLKWCARTCDGSGTALDDGLHVEALHELGRRRLRAVAATET
jgi:hypothetical protein